MKPTRNLWAEAATAATLVLLGSGCDSQSPTDLTDYDPVIVVEDARSGRWPAAATQISGHRVSRDTLSLDVSYSGGCATHVFRLVVSRTFAESFPVQTWGVLAHDDGGDPCDGVLVETLLFDLSPLKEAYWAGYGGGAGQLVLHVEGLAQSVLYTF